jgi:hypothetical protein
MTQTQSDLVNLAINKAQQHELPPELVCAVCEEESGKRGKPPGEREDWNPQATRYEPGFFAKYEADKFLPIDEEKARARSYGLMQIMGETARLVGFEGDFNQLYVPENSLEFGCIWLLNRMHLAIKRAPQDSTSNADSLWRATLLYWNGGSDLAYPSRVMVRVPKYRVSS